MNLNIYLSSTRVSDFTFFFRRLMMVRMLFVSSFYIEDCFDIRVSLFDSSICLWMYHYAFGRKTLVKQFLLYVQVLGTIIDKIGNTKTVLSSFFILMTYQHS